MTHVPGVLSAAFVLTLASAGSAFTQTMSTEASTAPIANVYVQTQKGVNVYNANAAGQLTLVNGSPFFESGQMEGVEGNYLISVGTDYLHTYALSTNGAVSKQASQINTQSYAGSQCGNTDSAGSILDHSGKYFSVQLYGATYTESGNTYTRCSAWQSYKIAPNGEMTFLGDAVNTEQHSYHGSAESIGISTVSSNDTFAYGVIYDVYATGFSAFRRDTAGDLVFNTSFSEKDPTPNPSNPDSNYFPNLIAADPASHLAVVMNMPFSSNDNIFQLASFTINDSTGAISSTNTWANMPTLQVYPTALALSWAGNFAAVGGVDTPDMSGLQIFRFNGAAPATAYGGVLLPKVGINQVGWDKSNHLYALSYASGELYVYTVTSTSISEAPGSPYKVSGAYGLKGLIVVPK